MKETLLEAETTIETSTWHEKGKALSQAHKRHQWEIADWLIEGIALWYPEGAPHDKATKVYDVAEQLFPEYTRTTFHEWVCVARAFGNLVRTKYPGLFFGHFRATLAVTAAPPHPQVPRPNHADEQNQALREQWLAQAQEKKLTVSALRFAIANAHAITLGGGIAPSPEEAPEEVVTTPPKVPPAKPSPSPAAQPASKWDGKLRLSQAHQTALDTLARGRGISSEVLATHAVTEYLNAHWDEIADACEQQAKRCAEVEAAEDAARAISEARRAEAARARQQEATIIWDELEPLHTYAKATNNTELLAEMDALAEQWNSGKLPLWGYGGFSGRVNKLLEKMPEPPRVDAALALMAAETAAEVLEPHADAEAAVVQ